jgi:hypothetical protein
MILKSKFQSKIHFVKISHDAQARLRRLARPGQPPTNQIR